jgi:hypothetical protein
MTLFNVQLQPLINVRVDNIEAESYEKAVEAAEKKVNMRAIFCIGNVYSTGAADSIEWTEEMPQALVDVVGDAEYKHSRWVVLDKRLAHPELYAKFSELVEWAKRICEFFGAPPTLIDDCHDILQSVEDDLRAQREPFRSRQ